MKIFYKERVMGERTERVILFLWGIWVGRGDKGGVSEGQFLAMNALKNKKSREKEGGGGEEKKGRGASAVTYSETE